jgi:hypothetical protein
MAIEDGGTAVNKIPAPRLGRSDREEIGRALVALYDDVVKQGVPAPAARLIDDLAARIEERAAPDAATTDPQLPPQPASGR